MDTGLRLPACAHPAGMFKAVSGLTAAHVIRGKIIESIGFQSIGGAFEPERGPGRPVPRGGAEAVAAGGHGEPKR